MVGVYIGYVGTLGSLFGNERVLLWFCGVSFVVGTLIQFFICTQLYDALKRLPPKYRQRDPYMVWLLLIPFLGLVWNFFIYPAIADSYKSYFTAQARWRSTVSPETRMYHMIKSQVNGDCGYGVGLAYCFCVIAIIIPGIGGFLAIAALVLLILFLAKISVLKSQVRSANIPGGNNNVVRETNDREIIGFLEQSSPPGALEDENAAIQTSDDSTGTANP